jgi:hypothetical protein
MSMLLTFTIKKNGDNVAHSDFPDNPKKYAPFHTKKML